jgi:hypothetical protein
MGQAATLSNPQPRMNPSGLPVFAAHGPPQKPGAAPFNLGRQPQPPIAMARSDFGYAKFTPPAAGVHALQCNMDFFSSSRKVLAPL